MTENTIVQETENYVKKLLSEDLSEDYLFHNLPHTLAVRDASLKLAQQLGVSGEDLEILELAALLHDIGYTVVYAGHEKESHRIADAFLKQHGYPKDKRQQVMACIDVTLSGAHPNNLLQQIIKDADLHNLANPDYLNSIMGLRHEWEIFVDQIYDDAQWHQLNYDFLKNHHYITPAARALFGPQKEANRKQLKKIIKNQKRGKPKKSASDLITIANSRSAQLMFKTALRNHLDLSNLADNKANIMLSVNALIITVAIPLVSSYMTKIPYLVYPMITLIASCLTSMIFATLATRPIRMAGHTSPEQIEAGESNLFFFGNFYSMTFKEYQEGMQKVVADEQNLESSIMRDLFFLGKSLGKKYWQLRICYNIFMIGMTLTVIVYAISSALQS